MFLFLWASTLCFFILEFLLFFWYIFDDFLFIKNLFIFTFIFFFCINFFSTENIENYDVNYDILYKYYLLFAKTPNYLLNFLINTFKKIYLYLRHFKYKFFIDTIYIFLKRHTKHYFVIWRPLFKKFSYFGYYRSNRSKWIK